MSEHPQTAHVDAADPNIPTDTEHRSHPNYLLVFLALAVLTALEVGVTYIHGLPHAPILLGMALLKALLVLLYFMHLRFDSKWFSFIFFIPFVLVIPFLIVMRIG